MTPAGDDQADVREPVSEALRAGADVQLRLASADEVTPELLDKAHEVMKQASASGEYAWMARDREQLDVIVRRLARTLRRAGRDVDETRERVMPFAGHSPSFEPMTPEELADEVRQGNAVIGRRLVAPDGGGGEIGVLDMSGAHIVDCAFVGWSFKGVDLSGARIIHSAFQSCSFDGTDLTRAAATTSLFSGPDGDAPFRVAADHANFSGSFIGSYDLTGASFVEASFSYAYLAGLTAGEGTSFRQATIDLASVEDLVARGADFTEATFAGSSLVRVDLREALLDRSVFSSAKVVGARFESARLTEANFRYAYFVGLAHFDRTGLDASMTDRDREELARKLEQGTSDTATVDVEGEEGAAGG